jgi:hypothetical protein
MKPIITTRIVRSRLEPNMLFINQELIWQGMSDGHSNLSHCTKKSREFGIKLGSNLFVFENPAAASSFGF